MILIATGLRSFFIPYCEHRKEKRQSFESEFVNEGKYTRALFEASLVVAKSKNPYDISEELILPAAMKMSAKSAQHHLQ